MRYHKMSLAEQPTLMGVGHHEMDRSLVDWYQPPDRYLLLSMWHRGILLANGVPHPFLPGAVFVIPPRMRFRIERPVDDDRMQYWAHFAPCESPQGVMAVPFAGSFADRLEPIRRDVLASEDIFVYSQAHSKALVWSLLWLVAEDPAKVRTHLVVDRAEALIHDRIGGNLRVADLARELLVSHNHLTRLFVRELGVTPREYIRNLRLEIAVRLLTTSTIPIKQIAIRVGVPDLRQFHRMVKDRLGMPPRSVRLHRQMPDLNRYRLTEDPRIGISPQVETSPGSRANL